MDTATRRAVPTYRAPDIEAHGAIGDLESVALVATDATIDWLCWPRIDSGSLFGALLDDHGGHWSLSPTDPIEQRHPFYVHRTNVLVTRLHTADGVVEVEDAMRLEAPRRLVRRVRCVRGNVAMASAIALRPDYARAPVSIERAGERVVHCDAPHGAVLVRATVPLDLESSTESGEPQTWATARFTVSEGDEVAFCIDSGTNDSVFDLAAARDDIEHTTTAWRAWSQQSSYRGRWREVVQRSALALKLLTNKSTGGVVAAATTSLPESIGGSRNWDYRFVWVRDAAFTIYALLKTGHHDEADAFADWLLARVDECSLDDGPPLVPLYDLDGNAKLDETLLEHWTGYEGSTPVRTGNAASTQQQLDIYGELIDSLYLYDKHVRALSLDTWERIRLLVDYVIGEWTTADHGIWEARCEPQRYTSSLLMCWVAIERAIRMASHRGRPADLDRWQEARDEIHDALVGDGWNDELGAFTQTLHGDQVDASILLAPLVKFVDGRDPRWTSTMRRVVDDLSHGPLVDRYDLERYDDGLDGSEGSFTICSFWLVEAMVRAGRLDAAQDLFDRLLSYSNHVGLYSEQIGPTGRQLGNFPQAFTHLALISAAIALDEALDAR